MALTKYLIEVRIANEKTLQIEIFADSNGSTNSDNPAIKKAVEDKIATVFPKKVNILGRKIIKKF